MKKDISVSLLAFYRRILDSEFRSLREKLSEHGGGCRNYGIAGPKPVRKGVFLLENTGFRHPEGARPGMTEKVAICGPELRAAR
jgi:hypothetical protein